MIINCAPFDSCYRGEEIDIKEMFPKFYEANKERVDLGRIKYFHDDNCTETGYLIDLDTLENYIFDHRSGLYNFTDKE